MQQVFLDFFKIRFPLAAIVSIKHRLSGLFFFLMFPLLLYMYSLLPLANELNEFCENLWVKVAIWMVISSFCYHLIAGIRHLIFDFGPFHGKEMINISAWFVMVLASIMVIWTACLIWGFV